MAQTVTDSPNKDGSRNSATTPVPVSDRASSDSGADSRGDSSLIASNGDFLKLASNLTQDKMLQGVIMNPGTPKSLHAGWRGGDDQYSQPYYSIKRAAYARNNSPGFMVVDPVIQEAVGKSGWVTKDKKPYGFRFHFNPSAFQESGRRATNVNIGEYLRTITEMKTPPSTVDTGLSITIPLLLARNEDMRILQLPNWADYYDIPPTPEQREAILSQGTMADLEYIFRMSNGEPMDTWRGVTSNWGMLIPTVVVVSVGDSKGCRKFRGVMQNVSWVHQQFYPGMIPVYTQVNLTFSRIPDSYVDVAPDASTANEENGGGGGGSGGNVPAGVNLPTAGKWTLPCFYIAQSSAYGSRTRNGVVEFHHGLDLDVGPKNTSPIYAALGGTVAAVGLEATSGGMGNSITIRREKDGFEMTYMHMKYPTKFAVGQEVKAGDGIGWVGTTGDSSGEHLHFQLNSLVKDGDNYTTGESFDPKECGFPPSNVNNEWPAPASKADG